MANWFKIWLKFAKMNLQSFMEYRVDFYVGMIFMAISNIVPIIFFWVLYSFTSQINGWSFYQVLFILGLDYLVIGIWHAFLTGISPWSIERMVQNGEFDRVLLQPIGAFKYLSFRRAVDNDGLGDLAAGFVILYYASTMISFAWSIPSILLLASFAIGGTLIFFSAAVVVSVISFISVKSTALWDVVWNFERFIEYPLDIFGTAVIFLMTFIVPFGFINYYPAQAFLGKGIWMQAAYLTPLVGALVFIAAYLFWRWGLRYYSGTGS